MSQSWCIMGFVNVDGSYDVSPLSTLVVMNWIFSLWSFVLLDWIFRDENTWYISCNMNTWGDNEVSYWFTWYVLWHSTHEFSRWYWGNLCIGLDACFSPMETIALCSLCGLSIMNLKLFDTCRIINSWVLTVTLGYLGDIRVCWYVSYCIILVRTLDWIDRKE